MNTAKNFEGERKNRLYEMNDANKKKANEKLTELQNYCQEKGLEIPFWITSQPPQLSEITQIEMETAAMAIECAKLVVDKPYDIFAQNLDFIPVP